MLMMPLNVDFPLVEGFPCGSNDYASFGFSQFTLGVSQIKIIRPS